MQKNWSSGNISRVPFSHSKLAWVDFVGSPLCSKTFSLGYLPSLLYAFSVLIRLARVIYNHLLFFANTLWKWSTRKLNSGSQRCLGLRALNSGSRDSRKIALIQKASPKIDHNKQQTKHVMTLYKNVRISIFGATESAANLLRPPGSTVK